MAPVSAASKQRMDAVRPVLLKCDIADRKLKDAIRSIAHQAVLSCASYSDVAAFVRVAVARHTGGQRWCAVVARGAYLHLRAITAQSATLLVPCLASELVAPTAAGETRPKAPPGTAFSIVLFQPAPDMVQAAAAPERSAAAAPGGGTAVVATGAPTATADGDGATPSNAEVDGDAPADSGDAAWSGAAAAPTGAERASVAGPPPLCRLEADGTMLPPADARRLLRIAGAVQRAVGLHSDAEAEYCARLKAALAADAAATAAAAESGAGGVAGTWHVVVAASPGRAVPPPAGRRDAAPEVAMDAVARARVPGFSLGVGAPGSVVVSVLQFTAAPSVAATAGAPGLLTSLPDRAQRATPARYHVCAFRTHVRASVAGVGDDDADGGAGVVAAMSRVWRRDPWTVGRIALYATAGALLAAYAGSTYGADNSCARTPEASGGGAGSAAALFSSAARGGGAGGTTSRGDVTSGPGVIDGRAGGADGADEFLLPTTVAPVAPLDAAGARGTIRRVRSAARAAVARAARAVGVRSAWANGDDAKARTADAAPLAPGELRAGCTLAAAEAAEGRLRIAQTMLYAGMVALGLLSLLRVVQRSSDAARLQQVLRTMPKVVGAAAAAAAGARAGGGGAGANALVAPGGGKRKAH